MRRNAPSAPAAPCPPASMARHVAPSQRRLAKRSRSADDGGAHRLTGPIPERQGDTDLPSGACCAICCGRLRTAVALIPCGHLYCSGCVAPWLRMRETCPSCRMRIRMAPLRLRAVDGLVEALAGSEPPKPPNEPSDAAMRVPVAVPKANPSSRSSSIAARGWGTAYIAPPSCDRCGERASDGYTCDVCEEDMGLCGLCAEVTMGECEQCGAWFCAWCSARPCGYCGRPHVCSNCSRSPLRRCPRPEC